MDNSQNSNHTQNQPQSTSVPPTPPRPNPVQPASPVAASVASSFQAAASGPNSASGPTPPSGRPVSPSTPPRVATAPANGPAPAARPNGPTSSATGFPPSTPTSSAPRGPIPTSPNAVTFGRSASAARPNAQPMNNLAANPANPATSNPFGPNPNAAALNASAGSATRPNPNNATASNFPPVPGAPTASNGPANSAANPLGPTNPLNPTNPNQKAPAKAGKKKISKKTIYIIIALVAILVAIGAAAAVFFIMQSSNKPEPTPEPIVSVEPPVDETSKEPIEDLDKDGLLAAFDEMYVDDYVPEDYLNETLVGYIQDGASLYLADSYTEVADVDDYALYGDSYEQNVEEVDDGYVIITAVDSKGKTATDQPVYVAFDVAKLDYSVADEEDADPNSPELPLTFVDTSEDFVAIASPILTTIYSSAPLNSIYSSETSEGDDGEVVFDTYVISLGFELSGTVSLNSDEDGNVSATTKTNSSSTNSATKSNTNTSDTDANETADDEDIDSTDETDTAESAYYIAAGRIQLTVDPDTGVASFALGEDGSTIEELTRFPLTEEEFTERFQIFSKVMGLNGVY